jgi:GNAT superfamily N-acetyltransferase
MIQLEVREAEMRDAPALSDLSSQLGYEASVREVELRLRAILASPENQVLVACLEDGMVIGWTHVFIAHRIESGRFGELGGFVVAEDSRRRGIGTALLGAAEVWLTTHRIERLRVRSRPGRGEAHAFFQRSGFSVTKDQRIFDKRIMIDT